MPTTRTPADDLAAKLLREGYAPSFSPVPAGWSCLLFNNEINGVPQAQGDTIYDALEAAARHRDAMVADGKYKKK